MKTECKWKENQDGIWENECGNSFEFTWGGPQENKFGYCPYCGKPVKEVKT